MNFWTPPRFLNGVFVPCQKQVVSNKIGEILIVHSTHKNKGLYSSNPEIDENDENGGCHPGKMSVCQKHCFDNPDNNCESGTS